MANKIDFKIGPGIGISANSLYVVSTSDGAINSGAVIIKGGASIGRTLSLSGSLLLQNGSNYTALKSSASSNTTYTLPSQYPSIGTSVLQSDTTGQMTWVPMVASAGGGSGSGTVDYGLQYSLATYPSAGTLVTNSDVSYNPITTKLSFSNITFVGNGNSAISISGVGNGGQILTTWSTLNSGLSLDALNASLRIVGDSNAGTTLVDFGVYDNSGFPTGNWNSKYLFPKSTSAVFVNGLSITNTTASTSSSSGALTVLGGVGIGQTLFTSSSYANSLSGVVLNNSVITSGTWAGSTITTLYGGTGLSAFTKGDLLVGLGDTLYKLPVGTQGQLLQAFSSTTSGLAWTSITPPTYGAFYSTQTQIVAGSGVSTPITLNATFEAYNTQIYGGSGTSSRIQIQTSGTYNIQFSAQINLANGNQPKKGDIWFRINGVDVPLSNTQMSITGKDYETVLALNFVSYFAGDDYFELVMSSTDTEYGIQALSGLTNPPRPDVPSMIVTVVPVTQIVGSSAGLGVSGIVSVNGLNQYIQYFATGRSGTDFNISSSSQTHTFNIPHAGIGATGLITSQTQTIGGNKTFVNDLIVSSTTVSNSTTSGALVVTGGVGIGGSLNVASATAISGVTINNGVITGNLTGFATTATNINVVSANNSALHYILFSPNATGSGVALSSLSSLTINPVTNVFSIGTGTFAANGISVGASSNTITTSSGQLNLDSVSGQTNINDNVVIQGNLTVQGTTITVDSTISTLVDPVIVLGSGVGGTHSTLDNNQDRGIEFRWSNAGTATTGFFGFSDTDGKFRFIPNASIPSANVYTGTAGTAVFTTVEATLAGNASGTAATYTNFYGNFVGTATTATNINVANAITNSAHPLHFSPNATGSGLATSSNTTLSYNPFSLILSTSGLAVTATTASTNSSSGALVVTGGVGIGDSLFVAGSISVNTGTNGLLFRKLVAGNYGAIYSTNVTPSATNYTMITDGASVNFNGTNGVYFNINNTNKIQVTANNINIVPTADSTSTSTGAFTVAGGVGIGGSLYVASATAISGVSINNGIVTGNLIGTATTGANVHLASTSNAVGPFYFAMTTASSGSGVALSTDTALQYNSSSDVLTVTNISGTAITASTSFSGQLFGNVTGTASTATYAHQSGYGITAGLATTATNINISSASNAVGPFYFAMTTASSGSGVALSTDTALQYNSASDVLSLSYLTGTAITATTSFSGSLIGNVTGTATTSTNVHLSNATSNSAHRLVFSPASTGSGVALSSSAQVSYNPSTFVLSSSGIAVTASTNSTASNTGALTVTGGVGIGQSLSIDGRIQFFNGANYTAFVSSATANTVYTLPATSPATGSSVLQSTSTGILSWVPLVASSSGNTAQNVVINSAGAADVFHPVLFTPSQITSGSAVSSDSLLTYNASSDRLFVSGIFVTSGTASTSTFTGGLLVAGGLGVSGQVSFTRASLGFTGVTGTPTMAFIGATTASYISLNVLSDNSLSFEGSSGQLFTIDNNLSTGEIFSVSDISGLPIISASAGQTVTLNEFGGVTKIGDGTANATSTTNAVLVVSGGLGVTGNAFIGGTSTITNNTISSSTSTGALVVTGGVGIGQSVSIGGRIQVFNGSNYTAFVSSATGNTVYTLPATSPATGSSVLSSTSGGVLSWVPMTSGASSGTVNSGTATYAAFYATTSTAVSENANLQFTGTGLSVGGNINSTSTRSGSLYVSGGLGVTGNAFIGGTTVIQNTTAATSTSSGAFVVAGGVGIGGSLYVGDAIRVGTDTYSKVFERGDILLDNGTTDSPGTKYYWQNNKNFGTDVYSPGTGITKYRIVKELGESGGQELVTIDREATLYLHNHTNTSLYAGFRFSGSGSTVYTLPSASPAIGTSYLVSNSSGVMSWIRPKRSYVLSFGAGFTPTTNSADTVQINIPYAPDNVALNYIVKRVEYRNETVAGGTGLSFYIERHTGGDALWSTAHRIHAGSGASFEVGALVNQISFTTINSSAGTNGLVASGDYIRLYFTTVGSAANVSISLTIEEQ